MRKLYLIMAAALFVGCGNVETRQTGLVIEGGSRVTEACLNGVKYYFWDRGLAPAYGTDQKVILCK